MRPLMQLLVLAASLRWRQNSNNECLHRIKIVNFEPKDIVTYPIVRVVGLVEPSRTSVCQTEDVGNDKITVIIHTLKAENIIHPKNNKFKILFELSEGLNEFTFSYGCRTLSLSLDYCPLNSGYTVMPVYVICEGHDGLFQAPSNENNDVTSACNRILLCSKLLQCFTAEKLLENGLGRKTFNLENTCQILRSKLNYLEARKMDQWQLWENIGRDILNSELASHKRNYLAFLSCTKYDGDRFSEDNIRNHKDALDITYAYVALGGGRLALFGTACLHTWPENFDDIIPRFENKTVIDKSKFLDDSCYRGTHGACFSTTLGAVLHELYHTFDLGHAAKGVMGRGFDNISKFFTTNDDGMKEDDIRKGYQNQIEFKEEFESDALSERLENEHKRKDFQIIRKFEENDWTFLTKSCAVILAYHKWLNSDSTAFTTPHTLSFDKSSKFIKSTAGIRVVEIRREPDEMVLHSWTFEGKILKFSFRLPDETVPKKVSVKLFVEDNGGNILKEFFDQGVPNTVYSLCR